jgi:hypothetical protein
MANDGVHFDALLDAYFCASSFRRAKSRPPEPPASSVWPLHIIPLQLQVYHIYCLQNAAVGIARSATPSQCGQTPNRKCVWYFCFFSSNKSTCAQIRRGHKKCQAKGTCTLENGEKKKNDGKVPNFWPRFGNKLGTSCRNQHKKRSCSRVRGSDQDPVL